MILQVENGDVSHLGYVRCPKYVSKGSYTELSSCKVLNSLVRENGLQTSAFINSADDVER